MDLREPRALLARLGLENTAARVLIINQVSRIARGPDTASSPPASLDAGRIRIKSFAERGVSRSRNRAIELSRGEVLLLSDDDLRYETGAFTDVLAAFDARPDAAAITFRCGGLGHRYPRLPGPHTARSVASVSSVEIAVAPTRLRGVRFDPAFGLGTPLPSGEEAIFLRDLQRAGASVRYAPITVCHHDHPSSGQGTWDAHMTRTKGAVLRRMYPRAWALPLAYFAATKRLPHAPGMGAAEFSRHLLLGALGAPPRPAQ